MAIIGIGRPTTHASAATQCKCCKSRLATQKLGHPAQEISSWARESLLNPIEPVVHRRRALIKLGRGGFGIVSHLLDDIGALVQYIIQELGLLLLLSHFIRELDMNADKPNHAVRRSSGAINQLLQDFLG